MCIPVTTLQDALQEVPQLLETCASQWFQGSYALGYRSGVKALRLVCKHTSITALQAVRRYHLTVSAEPSVSEPLLDVAGLLKTAQLKHLHLDIVAPARIGLRFLDANFASHITQMKLFFSAMGPLLRHVHSLEVTLAFSTIVTQPQVVYTQTTQLNNCRDTLLHTWKVPAPGEISAPAYKTITALLATAFPNVSRFGMGGNLDVVVVNHLASFWPGLTELEILGDEVSPYVLQDLVKKLPCLTLFKMKGAVPAADEAMYNYALWSCVALTHLFVGWNILGVQGFVPPVDLREVSCPNLPAKFGRGMQLPALMTLHLTDTIGEPIEIELLASLLLAAPRLHQLSSSRSVSNSVFIGPCTAFEVSAMFSLSDRISNTGFALAGISVKCGHKNASVVCTLGYLDATDEGAEESTESALPGEGGGTGLVLVSPIEHPDQATPLFSLQHVLTVMPAFEIFKTCTLSAVQGDKRSACIATALKMFPDVAELILVGPWKDVDLPTAGEFKSLEKVYVMEDAMLSTKALHMLIPRMPNLVQMTLARRAMPEDHLSAAINQERLCADVEADGKQGECWELEGWSRSTSIMSAVLNERSGDAVWSRRVRDVDP